MNSNNLIDYTDGPNSLREPNELHRQNIFRARGLPSQIIIKVDKRTPIDASPHHPIPELNKTFRPQTQINQLYDINNPSDLMESQSKSYVSRESRRRAS